MTWASSVLILVFLGLSVRDLGPMYATDRQTDMRPVVKVRGGEGVGSEGFPPPCSHFEPLQ